jgi:hypothetical protein
MQHTLLQKLDVFIRKYYRSQLLKGGLLMLFWSMLLFFAIAILEHFGRYGTTVRAMLFFTFVAGIIAFLLVYVLKPLMGLLRAGKTISYEEAARIVGTHFTDIQDQLLNTLHLQRMAAEQRSPLLEAAIEQKTQKLSPIPFQQAVDMKASLQYAKWLVFPVGMYLLAALLLPGMISDAPERIINYNKAYVAPPPFHFDIQNDELQVTQYEDFELQVKVSGNTLPDEVSLQVGDFTYMMQRQDKSTYSYTFRNVQRNQEFRFVAGKYETEPYLLKVNAKPAFQKLTVRLEYPGYLQRKPEVIDNAGDLRVPAGTTATWSVYATQTDELQFYFGNKMAPIQPLANNRFEHKQRLLNTQQYAIVLHNSSNRLSDSVGYHITVQPDAYPQLDVQHQRDSFTGRQFYFAGLASDDYGLSKLVFHYRFTETEDEQKSKTEKSIAITIPAKEATHRFTFPFDISGLEIAPGDQLEMSFEVWDNDGVQGPKSSRSTAITYKAPTIEELNKQADAANSAMKKEMQQALKEAQKLQQEMKELERKMADKRELTWEEKKKMEALLERQKKLNEKIDKLKNEFKQNNEREAEFKKQAEEILQKQQQLEKLMSEVMNDELKKLIKQMEMLMQQQNKDAIKQEMEKLQLNNKDVEKELDRMLEQFKQLEVEKKIEEAISKLDELQQKQEKLAEQTKELEQNKQLKKEEKQKQLEQLKQEQQKVREEFDQLQKQLDDARQQNKELEDPAQINDTEKQEEQIEQDMNDSEQELQKNNADKAAQKQKQAAQKMQEMSSNLKQGRQDEKEKEDALNAESLREILENTIQLSKDQEQLMEQMRSISGYNPQFVEAGKSQKNIADNARIIEDSLLALSKRVPQISSFVNREVSKLKENLDRSVKGYSNRSMGEIRNRQQYAMTHANNLAVMLSEILQQMQMEMQANGGEGGKKAKPKPGQGKGGKQQKRSMSDLKKMQEELNKQLREGMNKQQQQGGEKPGEQQGMGSKEFARMAAQQQAIRQQMQKLMNEMGAKEKEGMGGNQKLQEMQKLMEQTEKELFNKKLSSEMLQRQQDILTRMLESEKAEKKQEEDNKREAEQSKQKPKQAPPDFEDFFKQRQKETEWLQTIPAELQPYYKEKAKEYFNKISK